MRALMAGLLLIAAIRMAGALVFSPALAAEPPLRVGVTPGTPPFVVQGAGGQLSGFTVELMRVVAADMRRGITFTVAPRQALIDDLAADRIDMLGGPLMATPESAAGLLFTEGYLWTEYQFGSRAETPVTKLADLRGKRLAVVADSEYSGWAARNAGKLGFTVVSEPHAGDVFDAVRRGDADASLTGSPVLAGALGPHPGGNGDRHPRLVAGLSLPETRSQDAAAMAQTSSELRDEFEDAMNCLKLNGTVARLSQKWLGRQPGPEDLENLVVPGHGVPGLAGYDPKPQKPHCKS
jgi:polar amino acid transport system substrate-binding protein